MSPRFLINNLSLPIPQRTNNKNNADCTSTWRSSAPRDLVLLPAFCSTQQTVPTVVLYSRSLFVSLSWLARPVSIRSDPYTDDLRDPSRACRDLASLRCAAFQRQTRDGLFCVFPVWSSDGWPSKMLLSPHRRTPSDTTCSKLSTPRSRLLSTNASTRQLNKPSSKPDSRLSLKWLVSRFVYSIF
jgi:hypothetical protein